MGGGLHIGLLNPNLIQSGWIHQFDCQASTVSLLQVYISSVTDGPLGLGVGIGVGIGVRIGVGIGVRNGVCVHLDPYQINKSIRKVFA